MRHPRPRSIAALCGVLLLLAACWLPLAAREAPGLGWQWRAPLPQGNAVTAIAHGHGRYVAVGEGGTLLVSSDGSHWQRRPAAVAAALRAVAFGGGWFVAVGDGGAAARSANGIDWEAVDTGGTTTLYHVGHGDAGFVAAGGLTLLASADGGAWQEIDHGIETATFPPSLQGVAFGNGRYVVPVNVGIGGPAPARLLVSVDAATWTLHDLVPPPKGDWASGTVFFRGLAFGGGHFVAAGYRVSRGFTFRSVDGIHWEWFAMPTAPSGTALNMKSLAWDAANGRFVGLSNPNDPAPSPDLFPSVVASVDGGAFSHVADLAGPPIQPIRFAHDRLFGFTAHGEIHVSGDAVAWTRVTEPARAWSTAGFGANARGALLAGLGPAPVPLPLQERQGVVLHSDDGTTWNAVALPAPAAWTVRQVHAATAAPDAYVVAAQDTTGTVYAPPIQRSNALYVSADGAAWSRIDVAALGDVTALTSVGHGAGMLLATGSGSGGAVVLRSLDGGASWQRHAVTGTTLEPGRFTHGDAGFLALPPYGTTALRSTDGIDWTPVPVWDWSGGALVSTAWHDGVYLVLGRAFEAGVPAYWLLRSTDGAQSWEQTRLEDAASQLSATPSGFVLTATGGAVLTSVDGLQWQRDWSAAQSPGPAVELPGGRLQLATANGGVVERAGATADLAIEVAGPESFVRDGVVPYAVTVRNFGPSAAGDAEVAVAVDVPTANAAIAAPQGWACVPEAGRRYAATCTAGGAFAPGDATFALTVSTASRPAIPAFTVAAGVSAAEEDPETSNDVDSLRARQVRAPP